jgi:UDP-N-acetylmuramate dehydrogenase
MNIREHVELAPYTTLRIGGAARYLAECVTDEDVSEALRFADEHSVAAQVLGGGSNVIVNDRGFPGTILRIGLRGIHFEGEGDDVVITAAAGEDWDALVAETVRRGLSGIECLSGIPGLVGGTPIQNVGAYGQEIAETLETVTCLVRRTLERVTFAAGECAFAYRSSRFKYADRDRFVVLQVTLRVRTNARPQLKYPELIRSVEAASPLDALTPVQAVAAVRDVVLQLRRSKSMVVDPTDPNSCSAGSFFLNPVVSTQTFDHLQQRWRERHGEGASIPSFPAPDGVKVPAAWLVEQAGFSKGLRRNGVGISASHALALINTGDGTAHQLLALADEIQGAVRQTFGLILEREPVVIG